jgi:hypothetical protein
MPSTQTSTLGNFLSIFVILSIFIWIIAFVPKLKEGLKLLQGTISEMFRSPIIGLSISGVITFIYFSYYYISSQSLDDAAEKLISKFIFFWIMFLTVVATAMALYSTAN